MSDPMPSPEIRVHTSLRRAAASPASAADLQALRARAWLEQKVAVLHIDEITDPWLKQAVTNEMVKRHGRRMKR